jgi:Fur family ferric uptake transcriptional regulator
MADETQHLDWADHASERLAGAGYRRGGAREAVIGLLARQSCALSAFEIEEALRAGHRRVGRASVYRVLDELEQLRLVTKIEVGQGISRYEALHPGGHHHHHHLVCDSCGEVIPFEAEELERTIGRVAARVTFDVAEHEIVLHGSCGDCRR